MSDPWMKFYPSDWRADPALRMCSLAARGLWAEMMCIMHEAEPYGHLLVNGITLDAKQLASLSGGALRETVNALAELDCCGVLSRTEDGTIYSRRMKRDREKAERDKANGKGGGNPRLKAWVNPEDKAQKPEAREPEAKVKIESGTNDEFEEFKKVYPKRKGGNPWKSAFDVFTKLVRGGADPQEIIAAARDGIGFDRDKIGTEFIPQAVKWLRDERFRDRPPPISTAIGAVATVYFGPNTPQLDAWVEHERTTGQKFPRDRNGGWYFPSEWPPGHKDAA